uniref:GTP cyclohydrolase 1 n=1 Tax=Acrobeloides nanus TaxID=290746 RepID=A0A914CJ01_9BILA
MSVGYSSGISSSSITSDDNALIARVDLSVTSSPVPNKEKTIFNEDLPPQLDNMIKAYQTIIRNVGEDTERQGLAKTPERAAKAMLFFTKGYEENLYGKTIFHHFFDNKKRL